jgi:alkanesulfonate monooxygenase SsuD/methylene tetrahydromethanopterin reductase-like flavin-dependent oxidoreductase (luciferase family)
VLERAFPDFTEQPNDRILNELGGIGDEAEVVKAIDRYADAGATQVIVGRWGNHPGAATVEEMMVALSRHLPDPSRRSESV